MLSGKHPVSMYVYVIFVTIFSVMHKLSKIVTKILDSHKKDE